MHLFKLRHSLVLGMTCLLAFSAYSSAEEAPGAKTLDAQKQQFDKNRFKTDVLDRKHLVPNFHEVHPFLYRSGEPTEAGLKEIQSKGIKTIIDLRAPTEKALEEKSIAEKLGMKYINLPMSSKAPTKKQVDTFLSEVKDAKANPEKGSVLVHCAHGSDRTGCLVGIWRVTQDGWDYEKAYKEMRHYWFTPKFTNLSGAVKSYSQKTQASKSTAAK